MWGGGGQRVPNSVTYHLNGHFMTSSIISFTFQLDGSNGGSSAEDEEEPDFYAQANKGG